MDPRTPRAGCSLKTDEAFGDEVATGEVIVIASGRNEIETAFKAIKHGTCGARTTWRAVHDLAQAWDRDFDAILTEIETVRDG